MQYVRLTWLHYRHTSCRYKCDLSLYYAQEQIKLLAVSCVLVISVIGVGGVIAGVIVSLKIKKKSCFRPGLTQTRLYTCSGL